MQAPRRLASRMQAKLHPRTRVPVVATLMSGAASAIAAAFLPEYALVDMVSIGALMMFGSVCLSEFQLQLLVICNGRNELVRGRPSYCHGCVQVCCGVACINQERASKSSPVLSVCSPWAFPLWLSALRSSRQRKSASGCLCLVRGA